VNRGADDPGKPGLDGGAARRTARMGTVEAVVGATFPAGTFRTLGEMCGEWADVFEREYAKAPASKRLDPGLARDAIALWRELPASAGTEVLLCTDLHSENILAAEREPWLVIDPKPHIGDPAYDLLQHMLNCERLATDPAGLADRMASRADLDRERVRM
jgi:streptomycin 6-kinase